MEGRWHAVDVRWVGPSGASGVLRLLRLLISELSKPPAAGMVAYPASLSSAGPSRPGPDLGELGASALNRLIGAISTELRRGPASSAATDEGDRTLGALSVFVLVGSRGSAVGGSITGAIKRFVTP